VWPPLYSFFLDLSGLPRLKETKPTLPDSIQEKLHATGAAPGTDMLVYKLLGSQFYATLELHPGFNVVCEY